MSMAAQVWASPEWFPISIDPDRRRIQFVLMSPDAYRDSVFLDARTQHLGQIRWAEIEDLVGARAAGSAETSRVHYIFHTAYCCSTLLARYLEAQASLLVLKEPGVLSQVAIPAGESGPQTAALSLGLLSRAWRTDVGVIVKASDWATGIAGAALAANPAATATFQTVPLRAFILGVLKSSERRRWAHARSRLAGRQVAVPTPGTDGQAAALIWLVNCALGQRLMAAFPGRVGFLNGEELAARPELSLRRVLAGSCLQWTEADVSFAVRSAARYTYSKDPRGEFHSGARLRELSRLDDTYGSEADAAIEWAENIEATLPADRFCDIENIVMFRQKGLRPDRTDPVCEVG